MKLPADLANVVAALLVEYPPGAAIALDRVGAAVGVRAVSTDEIDAIFKQLEDAGRHVQAPSGGSGELHLKRVVEAARALKQLHPTRRPTVTEVAARGQLSPAEVLGALYLLRIMQRR